MKEKLAVASEYLQRVGKSLMLPIAVLPLAGLLLGIGYWIDPSGWGGESPLAAVLVKSGGAIIDNMSILFAVGVAYGIAKGEDRGSAMLAGLVAFLTITNLLSSDAVAQITSTEADKVSAAFGKINNQFIGILAGLLGGHLYNAFSQKELPSYLAFFSGRRLVPIVTGLSAIALSMILLFVWPALYDGLVSFGEAMGKLEHVGAGIYGFFNRLLIPFGLHHALNAVFWFDGFGINDIGSFFEGLKELPNGMHVGTYMSGFFPIFMFGLPAAALAMVHVAKPENRKRVASIMGAAALTSFVTGVTEVVEFAFLFAAPLLFVVHAAFTAISLTLASIFGFYSGFAFSAGAIDMGLNAKLAGAENWWGLLLMGLFVAPLYYFTFRFLITKFNLKTIGREDNMEDSPAAAVAGKAGDAKGSKWDVMAAAILKELGGKANLTSIDNCATRLRLEVKDNSKIVAKNIKATGASGLMKSGKKGVQVIIGPKVQFVADALRKLK